MTCDYKTLCLPEKKATLWILLCSEVTSYLTASLVLWLSSLPLDPSAWVRIPAWGVDTEPTQLLTLPLWLGDIHAPGHTWGRHIVGTWISPDPVTWGDGFLPPPPPNTTTHRLREAVYVIEIHTEAMSSYSVCPSYPGRD